MRARSPCRIVFWRYLVDENAGCVAKIKRAACVRSDVIALNIDAGGGDDATRAVITGNDVRYGGETTDRAPLVLLTRMPLRLFGTLLPFKLTP